MEREIGWAGTTGCGGDAHDIGEHGTPSLWLGVSLLLTAVVGWALVGVCSVFVDWKYWSTLALAALAFRVVRQAIGRPWRWLMSLTPFSLKHRIGLLEEKQIRLEQKNANLAELVEKLGQQLANKPTVDKFYEERGVAVKYVPGHGYADTPYCPGCKGPMTLRDGNYICFKCPYRSAADESALRSIVKRLNASINANGKDA